MTVNLSEGFNFIEQYLEGKSCLRTVNEMAILGSFNAINVLKSGRSVGVFGFDVYGTEVFMADLSLVTREAKNTATATTFAALGIIIKYHVMNVQSLKSIGNCLYCQPHGFVIRFRYGRSLEKFFLGAPSEGNFKFVNTDPQYLILKL